MLFPAPIRPIANEALRGLGIIFGVATVTGSPSTNSIGPAEPPLGSITDAP